MRKKKDLIISILAFICILSAVCLFLYSPFMYSVSDIVQVWKVGDAVEEIENLSSEDILKEKENAKYYNEWIFSQHQNGIYGYIGDGNWDQYYDKLLSFGTEATMGYLEVPKISVYIPIGHGTSSEQMTYEVGHMYGSSLPIGGESTHSVLAAHTGLNSAELFTHLDDLEKGDSFYVHILGEIHCYDVVSVVTVPQGQEAPYLKAEEGEDYITLYTCTPYGINTHRLLVKGKRKYPDLKEKKNGLSLQLKRNVGYQKAKAISLGLIPYVIFFFGIRLLIRQIKIYKMQKIDKACKHQKQK